MMGAVLIQQFWKRVDATTTGVCKACENAPRELGGNWIYGAVRDLAPRSNWRFPRPRPTVRLVASLRIQSHAFQLQAKVMAGGNPIRILCVDDHPVLREGIAAILASEADMALVAEAGNGREAIEQFRTHRPDVTLMDLQMPVMSGGEAILAIRKEFPDARIIVLTTYSGDVQADRAFRAGAYGYLLKNMLRKELVETIRTVHSGRRRIPPEIAVEMAEHHADDALTEREIDVLRQVASGNANKIIADHLEISEETVKAHMRKILSKLGANDRTHAVAIAVKRGIIDLDRQSH